MIPVSIDKSFPHFRLPCFLIDKQMSDAVKPRFLI